MPYTVAAFYRFTPLSDLVALQTRIKAFCLAHDVCGTLLLAPEGVNGTLAAPTEEQMYAAIAALDTVTGVTQGELKYSTASDKPFRRLKIQVKKEIITMKRPEADPNVQTGIHVAAADWNALLADPDVVLLDTRNIYETEIGTFKGAIDPRVETFTQFADHVDADIAAYQGKKVAMFCTGGVRCEKASSYLLHKGVETVYQLDGGILKYLETVPAAESLWEGTCFVFDDRAALGHGLSEHVRETRWPWRSTDETSV